MKTSKSTFTAIVAAGLTLCLGVALAPVAHAETVTATTVASAPVATVIAADRSKTVVATPTGTGQVSVITAPKTKIKVTGKNTNRIGASDSKGNSVIKNLTPGYTYTITTKVGSTKVTALKYVGKANGLTAETTDQFDTVNLTWNHKNTRATGGKATTYVVTATPTDSQKEISVTTSEKSTLLGGLDPKVLYRFSVTPVNAIGAGGSSTAIMDRSLFSITGKLGTPATKPLDSPTTKPLVTPKTPEPAIVSPAAQANSNPQPSKPAGPTTKTIYVCPSGFSEVGALCEKSQAYTFHDETETRGYTYHTVMENYGPWKDFGTDWSGTTCPNGGTLTPGQGCMGYDSRPVSVKDSTPAGFSDTGSGWSKTVAVKDAAPAGYSDTGSAWVQTAAKEAKVVPV